ncbi:NHL repeat-containing protein [Pseudothauera rhizosphaerae]|uniref:Uncharacterized protein n=1 Tax=Pseudothauera rhizosphaerae TaxID=2565932 RepID=A0A4S4ASL5_9RHOO|nr:hypothetical protein [Pseudothauera rhizosphaerae]THF62728.1 hypothetical protein E6O51_07150 [Pseudothauera rhizosphaerae]
MKPSHLLIAAWLALPVWGHATDGVEIVVEQVGFAKPESVVHDTRNDVYLVSNINGLVSGPAGKGFISRIAPDGRVLQLKWIDGGAPGTTLHHPAGLAIADGVLYVADGGGEGGPAAVRLFDADTGAPLGEAVHAPGASSNGLVVLPGGDVLGTHSAWKRSEGRLGSREDVDNRSRTDVWRQWDGNLWIPSGQDAIYRIGRDLKISTFARSPLLRQPNGITLLPGGNLLTVSSNGGILYELTPDGQQTNVRALPHQGFFDGVGATPDGKVFVSHHKGVYRILPDGGSRPVFDLNTHVADFHFDLKRGRILLPLIYAHKLVVARIP